jgi:3-keto-disaccharide hydrolase
MRKLITGWLLFAAAIAAAADKHPGTPLFDGKTLQGWKQLGGAADYKVADGAIVGSSRPGVPNSFLVTEKAYGDFILEFDVRQDVGPTNSGMQFRSLSTPDFENGRVHGYQADIDPSPRQWSGQIYEEAQRGWFTTGEMNPPSKALYRFGDWNHYRIEAIGPRMRVWINDGPVADLIDDVTPVGFFGLQVHSINSADEAGRTTTWKNLYVQTRNLKPLPKMNILIRNNIANNLDADEKAQGWRLLWDGKTSQGWHSAQGGAFPAQGWSLTNGELAVQPREEGKSGGGDIVTDEEFGAFELQLDFKVSAGANSGIIYLLTAAHDPASNAPLGLEYQILDDERHPDAKLGTDGNRTLASLYDVLPRAKLMTNVGIAPKVDAWQHARIVCRADGAVEHWLNGVKVLEFDRHSADFKAHVAASKFRDTPGFGQAAKGRILLQDHGDAVVYRSIKIRSL